MKPDSTEPSAVLTLLSLCELFSEIDFTDEEALAAEMKIVRLRGGEVLMEEGEPANSMYAVVSGRVRLFVKGRNGDPESLGEIGRAETVGEFDLIGAGARLTTARAVRETEVVSVSREAFLQLLERHPDMRSRLLSALAGRLRTVIRRDIPPPEVRTIAVIGAGEHPPVASFTTSLAEALGRFGEVLHMDQPRFRGLFGGGSEFDNRQNNATWLAELEHTYRFIVYEAGAAASPWAAHCVQQADCVIAVGRASSPPVLSPAEKLIDADPHTRGLHRELVLLHEDGVRVSAGTSSWFDSRPISRHHHVGAQSERDMERLARILAGRAIGLALGGGGARGFAHIGVIRAIEEAGIPVDMVGGVSMGSIIAAQHALGYDWQAMVRMNRKEIRNLGYDVTLPLLSISSGRRFRRALRTFFGDTRIEDLWLNYTCLSANLSTSELAIHQRGSLRKYVAASNAVPGVLPPVVDSGSVLVDGGIINNQGGDVLKTMCGGSVIVSNVSPRREMSVDPAVTEMPSAWKVLWKQINPFSAPAKVPNITAMMMRTLMVASEKKSREVERAADFYLRPPIDRFRLTDYSKVEEIAEVGYRYTVREVARWRADGRI